MKLHSLATIRHSKDFYSAVIRFSLGVFIALYFWVGMSSGEFILTQHEYNSFASFFFITTIILGADIFRNPDSSIRRYITLVFDFSCTTYAIILTGGSSSEFILIYIWLYIAYGTRYGSRYLFTAVGLVLVEYNAVLISSNAWNSSILGSCAQIFVLVTMPLYLHSMLKQLREAKKAAESATRAKSDFLATMSHEIRTPMSGIIGTAYLLQKTHQDKEQKEYTRALLDASKSLHALIDDILDFSKIEANKLHLQKATFDLHHCIDEVVTVLSPNAEYHSLDLTVYIDPLLPSQVVGDSQRIKQILFNLLGNAIKFTEKGEIILKVTELDPSATHNMPSATQDKKTINLCFDIFDTGIGMNNEQQALIFNSFTQANNLQTQKFGGTGLGTTIAKQLVEFMGGKIGLNSVLGSGSHFWFTLSLPIEQNTGNINPYQHIFADKRIAILVCKNALYETLDNYCRFCGFSVERFYSDSELLNGLQQSVKHEQPFELILLSSPRDKDAPIELATQINALDYKNYPIPKKVYLNYLDKQTTTQKLGGSLFDSYITKPVSFERLCNTLLELLSPQNAQTSQDNSSQSEQRSLTILIAEDEDINAMVLSSFLQDAGHKTKRVHNGDQAVKELARKYYDIAFMDMRMPEMNGIDATSAWRKQEPIDTHIPIIALTANATKDDRQSCMEAGMDDFITKPITPEQLSAAIRKFYPER